MVRHYKNRIELEAEIASLEDALAQATTRAVRIQNELLYMRRECQQLTEALLRSDNRELANNRHMLKQSREIATLRAEAERVDNLLSKYLAEEALKSA